MEFTKLSTKIRAAKGKGPARRMRRDGLVPAVIYGKSMETIPITVIPRELTEALSGPLHVNTVLELSIDGAPKGVAKEIHVLVADHQYHPVRRDLLHVDFLAVDVTKPVTVEIPLIVVGKSIGEQTGGIVSQVFRSLSLDCLPAAIPERIEVDITELDVNDSLSIKDLTLPEGVAVALSPETTIVSVITPKVVEEETPEGEEGEEGVEGEEGEEKTEEGAEDSEKKE